MPGIDLAVQDIGQQARRPALIAFSRSMPVGLPCASRSMRPPSGSLVLASMPAGLQRRRIRPARMAVHIVEIGRAVAGDLVEAMAALGSL